MNLMIYIDWSTSDIFRIQNNFWTILNRWLDEKPFMLQANQATDADNRTLKIGLMAIGKSRMAVAELSQNRDRLLDTTPNRLNPDYPVKRPDENISRTASPESRDTRGLGRDWPRALGKSFEIIENFLFFSKWASWIFSANVTVTAAMTNESNHSSTPPPQHPARPRSSCNHR